MKINDIVTAAQSLANYCYREGEAADLRILSAQAGLIFGHVTELQDIKEAQEKAAKANG
jgi:hypothetical protein